MKRLITPALISGAALSLAACANQYDPGQRAMAGMPAGAATGAAIGAGIGMIAGPPGAAAGALIGAGVGATGGAGVGAATTPQAAYAPPQPRPSAAYIPWPQQQPQPPQLVYVVPPAQKETVVVREQPQTIIEHDWPDQQLTARERTVAERYEGYHPAY